MDLRDFILDMLDRMQGAVTAAVDGLTHDELRWRPGPDANSIGFILWHQVRCEEVIVQSMIQRKPQVWELEKWHEKLNLPENPMDVGYGYTAEQIASFPVPELSDLLAYSNAVRSQTVECLKSMTSDKFSEVLQTPFFGEITIAKLFGHLLSEVTLHIGQIAYLRGLQRGLDK